MIQSPAIQAQTEIAPFYNSAITKPDLCAHIMVEMGSHLTKKEFLFNHTTLFSTKGLEKSLYDFTGTIFAQCENLVIAQERDHTTSETQTLHAHAPRTLLRKPLSTDAAFTDSERGIRIVFSKITANHKARSHFCTTAARQSRPLQLTQSSRVDQTQDPQSVAQLVLSLLTLEEIVLCVLVRIVCLSDDVERGSSGEHFEHEHPESPPINTRVCKSEQWFSTNNEHVSTGFLVVFSQSHRT